MWFSHDSTGTSIFVLARITRVHVCSRAPLKRFSFHFSPLPAYGWPKRQNTGLKCFQWLLKTTVNDLSYVKYKQPPKVNTSLLYAKWIWLPSWSGLNKKINALWMKWGRWPYVIFDWMTNTFWLKWSLILWTNFNSNTTELREFT